MNAPLKKATGLKRIINAGGYSLAGLKDTFRTEEAFRQEIALACILIPASFFIDTSAVGHALLIASVLLVLLTELLNTAIETLVSRISDEIHELSRRAKDIGSAAVFISLINLLIVWGIIIAGPSAP